MESLKDLAGGCAGVMDIDDSFKGESSQIEDVRKEVMAESLGVRKPGSSLTRGMEVKQKTESGIQERRQHPHTHPKGHVRTLPWAQISHQPYIIVKNLA